MAEVNAGGEPPSKKLKFGADALVLPERTIELLRKSLLALEQVPYCFNLIKINNSNADEDYPFSKTYIKIERSSNKVNADYKKVYSFGSIFMDGVKVLTSFLNDPKKNPTEKEIRIALQRLVQTTSRIEDIGEKLAMKIRSQEREEKKNKTEWCITLANHLLKELSVNQQYRLDMQSKSKVDACSCCKEPVYYDDCSLGNSKVWHGNVDMFMGSHPEILVHVSGDPSDADAEESSFEEKDTLINNIPQIISETIVFAFLKKKENPSFENYLIPTVGISKSDILIYMYDPEYDILLESAPLSIFESTKLNYPSVLALWLVLNYKMFCTGVTKGMIDRNFTADFLSGTTREIQTIYKEKLQFRLCGTGPAISDYRFKPQPGGRYEIKKSKPVKPSGRLIDILMS